MLSAQMNQPQDLAWVAWGLLGLSLMHLFGGYRLFLVLVFLNGFGFGGWLGVGLLTGWLGPLPLWLSLIAYALAGIAAGGIALWSIRAFVFLAGFLSVGGLVALYLNSQGYSSTAALLGGSLPGLIAGGALYMLFKPACILLSSLAGGLGLAISITALMGKTSIAFDPQHPLETVATVNLHDPLFWIIAVVGAILGIAIQHRLERRLGPGAWDPRGPLRAGEYTLPPRGRFAATGGGARFTPDEKRLPAAPRNRVEHPEVKTNRMDLDIKVKDSADFLEFGKGDDK